MRILIPTALLCLAAPAAAEPPASQPASQPAASQPAASQPAASQPAASQPAASQPAASQPHGHGHADGFKHAFADPEEWAKRFDAPDRDAWQKPDAVVAKLELAPDAKVADVGAGTGYFTLRLARAVTAGKVFGADIEPKMVEYLSARAAKAGLANVQGVVATAEGVPLPAPVDLVFACNTWHHIGGRVEWLKRARAQLAPGGRIAIVDYAMHWEGQGPPKHARLTPEAVIAEFAAAGFEVAERDEALLPRQYLLIFRPTP